MQGIAVFALTVSAAQAARHPAQNPDVIYGDDNRLDVHQVQDPAWKQIAASTAALFRSSSVSVSGNTAQLATRPLGPRLQLCEEEPFYNQGAGAFCSASLVAPDLVMTAGHCVAPPRAGITIEEMCDNTTIVFDFAVRDSSGASPSSVPASSVYRCAKVVQHALDGSSKNDFALIQLDRPVTDRAALPVNRSGIAPRGTPLVLIGHPSGLPVKVAAGAWVRDDSNPVYLVANTDSYGGNSGSAVVNGTTGQIEGILVRGVTDYVPADGRSCMVSNRCADDGCDGESITRVNMLSQFIPEGAGEPALPGQPQPGAGEPGFWEPWRPWP